MEDILQETNVTLWKKRGNFTSGTNFTAWAFQIARYEVHHHRDRVKRRQNLLFSDDFLALIATEHEAAGNHQDRLASALEHCLGKLSETDSAIVHHRYTPGLSLEKLAADTGRSPGSLRISLMRIREGLKKCVEKRLANQQS